MPFLHPSLDRRVTFGGQQLKLFLEKRLGANWYRINSFECFFCSQYYWDLVWLDTPIFYTSVWCRNQDFSRVQNLEKWDSRGSRPLQLWDSEWMTCGTYLKLQGNGFDRGYAKFATKTRWILYIGIEELLQFFTTSILSVATMTIAINIFSSFGQISWDNSEGNPWVCHQLVGVCVVRLCHQILQPELLQSTWRPFGHWPISVTKIHRPGLEPKMLDNHTVSDAPQQTHSFKGNLSN